MNKLPLPNLPNTPQGAENYDRVLNLKLGEILSANRRAINSLIQNPNLPVHVNNAAALAGGLVAGDFYRTGGDPDNVCVVH